MTYIVGRIMAGNLGLAKGWVHISLLAQSDLLTFSFVVNRAAARFRRA